MKKLLLLILFLNIYSPIFSQTINVVNREDNKPIPNAKVFVKELNQTYTTNKEGKIQLPKSSYTIINVEVQSSKYELLQTNLNISNSESDLLISLTPKVFKFDDVTVYSATRQKQKITESPAAIYSQSPEQIRAISRTGQIAQVFQNFTGIDVLQNGASDFIVNTRGFNGGLNRRILVLQDGRDASMPLLGAQEWNSFSMPLDEFSRIEFIRGPAASLYGANAFNGVMNLTSYSPKEVLGAKASVIAGDYQTYRADARYAGEWSLFSYKLSIGTSQRLNYSTRRDSIQLLEYSGLPLERKILTEDDRMTKSLYGSLRMDFDLGKEKVITSEFGYSRNTNEMFVFGLGRTFVKDVERPYARIAFNTNNFHLQAHYMQRHTMDTMWLMVPNAPLLDNSKDIFIESQYNLKAMDNLSFVFGASQDFQFIRTFGTSLPNDVDANYTGLYSQVDYKTNFKIDVVASARVDFASIHETQFSPRIAFVYKPKSNHNLRISGGRSFQRPNYSELYRLTPDAPAFDPKTGKPVNFTAIQKQINDTLAALTGTDPQLNFGLSAMNSKAIGNPNLKVENNVGIDFGYEGTFFNHFKFSADVYYNQINDFVTNFLPKVNTDIPEWTPNLPENLKQYTDLVKSMVYSPLNARDKLRLSDYNGVPTFVVSNTNVGKIVQGGLELNLMYFYNKNLSAELGYSNYKFKVIEANDYQNILPNTSPNKYKVAVAYQKSNFIDVRIDYNYTEGFDWLAGTYVGEVPSYSLVNLNLGFYPINGLELGVNIFNLLDTKHYQMFGGTYLPRYTTFKLSYTI